MSRQTANAEPDTFRRLVEGEIEVDEYVKSLEERVREGTEGGSPSQGSPPAEPRRTEAMP